MTLTNIIVTDCVAIRLTAACDEWLVASAKKGDQHAYAELCRRYSKRTLRVVGRIMRNTEDAEDALQESLMKAFIFLCNFDERSAFSTWLTRIAINSALMRLRKRRDHRECSLDSCSGAENQGSLEIVGDSGGPEEFYISSETERRLRFAISRLLPRLRSVIEVRQSTDATVREIADALGISESAAKSRLFRARISLRTSLKHHARYLSSAALADLTSGYTKGLEA
jgi:RNA polymerase sigma factor (sigma-70 family)